MKKINIAIDGPGAAGKSTIADALCEKLGYVHLDTGAMYRCVSLKALNEGLALDDEKAVCKMLEDTDIEPQADGRVLLDGRDVSHAIRTDENSMAASTVSKLPLVRRELVRRQQLMAENGGYVLDGRDIGTVVLPDADVKVFLTADPLIRAKRRYKQNIEKGIATGTVEDIVAEIAARDEQDMNRDASPLKMADDAILVDTSDMTVEEAVKAIYTLCQPLLKEGASA